MVQDWRAIKVVATDIDGTLTSSGVFSEQVLWALHALRAAGFTLILVTGRPSGWVQGLVSYLPVDAAIAENGGVIFPGPESAPWLRDEGTAGYAPLSDSLPREKLSRVFAELCARHPLLQVTEDNLYRLSDFTFHAAGLDPAMLLQLQAEVENLGCAFTWSTIHAHIMPHGQNKGAALRWLLKRMGFEDAPATTTLTVGDSPNDATLFEKDFFPFSAGVANIVKYRGLMSAYPQKVSERSEGEGFVEIAQTLLRERGATL